MANTCDDAFQEIQALQQRKQELERQLQESERARKAGEVFTRAEVGNKVLLPGRDGTVRELDDKDISQGLRHWADAMESEELTQYVEQSIHGRARPNGAEGQFINFRQMLEEIRDVDEVADMAKVSRALGISWEKIAPEDNAFVRTIYGKERMAKVIADAYQEFGLEPNKLVARMTNDTAAFVGLVERLARTKLFAGASLADFVDATDEILAFMQRVPGAQVPDALKQKTYKAYKWALWGERNFAFNRRATGQSLRSLQDGVEIDDLTLP